MEKIPLKQWRTELGLTQKEAAQNLGISLRTVKYWERGKIPNYPHLILLAMAAVKKRLSPWTPKI